MSNRKIIEAYKERVCLYEILDNNTPDEVIEIMEILKKRFEGCDIYFNVTNYGEDGLEIKLFERREENDKEYKQRIIKEKRIKTEQDTRELIEYQRLHKKFAGMA